MATKRAAELRPGDRVQVGDTTRIVWYIQFTGLAVDSEGTSGLRIYWVGTGYVPSTVRVDKEFTILNAKETT